MELIVAIVTSGQRIKRLSRTDNLGHLGRWEKVKSTDQLGKKRLTGCWEVTQMTQPLS